jgi:hypothetical protein
MNGSSDYMNGMKLKVPLEYALVKVIQSGEATNKLDFSYQ